MSASLVGSEMCIRDSSKGPAPRPRTSRKGCAPSPASARLTRGRSSRLASVSYTHLTLPTICSV
eukprot:9017664-Alexandrium_andersonii.AAC.1